tara:strand:- start:147 stop:689 length:543 start_codon:yes stop_codon:yes gene_type:complete
MFIMKRLLILFIISMSYGEDIYLTRQGIVEFFSSTPIEDIKAYNNQVSCVLNYESGKFAFQVPIKGFMFKNGLMQEHFNENYLESDIYPKSIFKGMINNWDSLAINDSTLNIRLVGELTIHGVTKTIEQNATIWRKNGNLVGKCKFIISLEDYDVKIPKIVRQNIAELIEINVNVNLSKR